MENYINSKSEIWEIGRLKEWEKNPRKITKDGLERLKKQITKFKIYKPFLITPDGLVLGGNMRLKACRELGIKKVWVSIVKPKNENEMLEYALSDNDRAGFYEKELLNTHFPNLDIDKTLFSLDYKEPIKLEDFVLLNQDLKEDDIPEVKEKDVKSKLGEIYQLGRHRLLCGDATKKEDLKKLMVGKKESRLFTDPPYNVNYDSPGGHFYKKGKHKKITNDNLSDENFLKFMEAALKNAYDITSDNASFYVWYAIKNQHIVKEALTNSGYHSSQVIIWVKNHFVLSGLDYQKTYEPCMYGWKKDKKHFFNIHVTEKDVMWLEKETFIELMDSWYEKKDNVLIYDHPTQKPVRLAGRAIKYSSQIDDIILDLFAGSGSTLIACEQLKRTAYLMELDPYYCDVIRKRYAKFIGKEDQWETETQKI